jgi:hypothetical protein
MPKESKPSSAERRTAPKQPEQIELLKLKAVNGYRRRIRGILQKWGVVLGLGTLAGAGVGSYAQEKYRKMTGYDPNPKPTQVAPAEEDLEEEDSEGLLDEAKKTLQKAKEWSKKKIDSAFERTKLAKSYRETKKQVSNKYRGLLKAGDEAAYWMSFLLTFLAATLLASKIIETKKALSQSVDPGVERNLQEIQAKINEVIARINAGGSVSKKDLIGLEPTVFADIDGKIGNTEAEDGEFSLGAAGSKKPSEE